MDNNCINCDLPVDPTTPHKVLRLDVVQRNGRDSGTITPLESWPLCADCEQSQPSTLNNYVRMALT